MVIRELQMVRALLIRNYVPAPAEEDDMSSPDHAIQFSDFEMINRVLVRAGHRGTLAEVDISATSDAATFLLEKFGNGVTSEDDLVALLNQRGRSLEQADDTPVQIRSQALDRWEDEGGNRP